MGIVLLFLTFSIGCVYVEASSAHRNGTVQDAGRVSFCQVDGGQDWQLRAQERFSALHGDGSADVALPCSAFLHKLVCSEGVAPVKWSPEEEAKPAALPPLCLGGFCEAAFRDCGHSVFQEDLFTPKGSSMQDIFGSFDAFARTHCRKPTEGHCLSPENFELGGDGDSSFDLTNGGSLRAGWGNSSRSPRRSLAAVAPTICFERLDTGTGLSLQFIPGARGRALLANQAGSIALVNVPAAGAAGTITHLGTFLDLTARVFYNGERGLLGLALHPRFMTNGRFFVSYICDSSIHPDCQGPCGCTVANGCDVNVRPKAGCTSNTVVAEYSAGSRPLTAAAASAGEVRRILTYGRPYSNHNGGDIFFGRDGFLYYTSGDGGFQGDPWNFAQKRTTLLGKILRLDINKIPAGKGYGIPPSNPFVSIAGARPEIFALGLRNPWRCSVDRLNAFIFFGDVGQDLVEEVDRLVSGGNYGWHNFEGTRPYKATGFTPGGFTPVAQFLGKLKGPIFQYNHPLGVAVIGGYVYRAAKNKCLQGKYIYCDMIGPMWVGSVYKAKPTTVRAQYVCAATSAIACTKTATGGTSLGNSFWSWAEDTQGEVYLLSDTGVYRIADASRCGVAC